jgi:outer membrane biosynthesis protein TonB
LELLKQEFRNKFEVTNPVLTDITMWCLNHQYEDRPDFLELEEKFGKLILSDKPFVSQIIPVSSEKLILMKSEAKEPEIEEKKPQENFTYHNAHNYNYFVKSKKVKKEPEIIEEVKPEPKSPEKEEKEEIVKIVKKVEKEEKIEISIIEPEKKEITDPYPKRVYKEKIFDDSQDFYYRPKIEYKTNKLTLGPSRMIRVNRETSDYNDTKIFDMTYEEEEVKVKKEKWFLGL